MCFSVQLKYEAHRLENFCVQLKFQVQSITSSSIVLSCFLMPNFTCQCGIFSAVHSQICTHGSTTKDSNAIFVFADAKRPLRMPPSKCLVAHLFKEFSPS